VSAPKMPDESIHTAGSWNCFKLAAQYMGRFGLPAALVTGNHDLEGTEFETDADNLAAWSEVAPPPPLPSPPYLHTNILHWNLSEVIFISALPCKWNTSLPALATSRVGWIVDPTNPPPPTHPSPHFLQSQKCEFVRSSAIVPFRKHYTTIVFPCLSPIETGFFSPYVTQ
jgi:hypothetical protein